MRLATAVCAPVRCPTRRPRSGHTATLPTDLALDAAGGTQAVSCLHEPPGVDRRPTMRSVLGVSCWLNVIFWGVALAASSLYGWNAFAIFTNANPRDLPKAQVYHQRWFNFVGSLVGWGLAYYELGRLFASIPGAVPSPTLGFVDVFLVFIAVLGITGHIPYVFLKAGVSSPEGLKDVVDKVSG